MSTTITDRIRSFVLRQGRLTRAQSHALDHYGAERLLVNPSPLELVEWVGNRSCYLEVGFGMGHALVELALRNPESCFIGVEVHTPGVGSLLDQCHQNNIQNCRIFHQDVQLVLAQHIPSGFFDGVYVLFPDPWPKRKHHKRRIIQPAFLNLLLPKIKQNGFLHCATDWEDYAKHMYSVLSSHPLLANDLELDASCKETYRPETKFEKRGERLGHEIHDFRFRVVSSA